MATNIDQLYQELFGESRKQEKYTYEPHNFSGKVTGKSYCVKCGLIALNNDFSRWSVDKGCNSDLHPQYKSKRKVTNPF